MSNYRTYNDVEAELFEVSKQVMLLEQMRNAGNLGVTGENELHTHTLKMTALQQELKSIQRDGALWNGQQIAYPFLQDTFNAPKNMEVPEAFIEQVNQFVTEEVASRPATLQDSINMLTSEIRDLKEKQGLGTKLLKKGFSAAKQIGKQMWNAIPDEPKSDKKMGGRRINNSEDEEVRDPTKVDQFGDFELPAQADGGDWSVEAIGQRLIKNAETAGGILRNVQTELETIANTMIDDNKFSVLQYIRNLNDAISSCGNDMPFDLDLKNAAKGWKSGDFE